MHYFYSIENIRIMFFFFLIWVNVTMCSINSFILCEDILTMAFHTLLQDAPALWLGQKCHRMLRDVSARLEDWDNINSPTSLVWLQYSVIQPLNKYILCKVLRIRGEENRQDPYPHAD